MFEVDSLVGEEGYFEVDTESDGKPEQLVEKRRGVGEFGGDGEHSS